MCATPSEAQMTETLARHFGEFGVLESVRVKGWNPNPNPNPNPTLTQGLEP